MTNHEDRMRNQDIVFILKLALTVETFYERDYDLVYPCNVHVYKLISDLMVSVEA